MNNDFPADGPDSLAEVEKRPSEVALNALVRQIADKIYEYEDGLSDGYDYYGGDYSVKSLARAIAELMPNTSISEISKRGAE
jgi:hypothetical protein